jgi:hypothetical protein
MTGPVGIWEAQHETVEEGASVLALFEFPSCEECWHTMGYDRVEQNPTPVLTILQVKHGNERQMYLQVWACTASSN